MQVNHPVWTSISLFLSLTTTNMQLNHPVWTSITTDEISFTTNYTILKEQKNLWKLNTLDSSHLFFTHVILRCIFHCIYQEVTNNSNIIIWHKEAWDHSKAYKRNIWYNHYLNNTELDCFPGIIASWLSAKWQMSLKTDWFSSCNS